MQAFSGKRVLITGHTGFKGSWLTQIMLDSGAAVCGVSLPPCYEGSLHALLAHHDTIESHYIDINDLDALSQVFQAFKPEYVFHLAAQALVRPSYIDPITTYETNVLGSLKVLTCCKALDSLKSVVMVTTDKCYENKEWVWPYRETDALGGYDLYSSSKACNELVVKSFVQSYQGELTEKGIRISTARAGNVIGGGDWADDRLVPDIFRAIKNEHPLDIRNPKAVRPWQHVLEPLIGYMQLALAQQHGVAFEGAWNFGPGTNSVLSVETLIELIKSKLTRSFDWSLDHREHVHEAQNLMLDCSKANMKLGWVPQFSAQECIEKTIEVYEALLMNLNPKSLIQQQIKDYLNGV